MNAQTKGNVTNAVVETLLMELEDDKYWKPVLPPEGGGHSYRYTGKACYNREGSDLIKSIRFFIDSQDINFNIFLYVKNLRKAKGSPELLDSECYKDGTPIIASTKFFHSWINNCPDAYQYSADDTENLIHSIK